MVVPSLVVIVAIRNSPWFPGRGSAFNGVVRFDVPAAANAKKAAPPIRTSRLVGCAMIGSKNHLMPRPRRASTRGDLPGLIVGCALRNADVSEDRFSTNEESRETGSSRNTSSFAPCTLALDEVQDVALMSRI